jgi:DNA-binding PadR family transcriptional regulator
MSEEELLDKVTIKLNIEILRILSKENGQLKGKEIEDRLPDVHKPKLTESVPHFPQLRKDINYRLTQLETIGFVSGFDKSGNEREYIPLSEKYYEITQKGKAVVGGIPKTKEEFAGRLFDIIGEYVVERSGRRPEEVYKLFLEIQQ